MLQPAEGGSFYGWADRRCSCLLHHAALHLHSTAGVMAAVLLSVAMDSVDSSFNFHGSERVDDLVGHVVRQAESDVALLGDRGPAMRDDNAG